VPAALLSVVPCGHLQRRSGDERIRAEAKARKRNRDASGLLASGVASPAASPRLLKLVAVPMEVATEVVTATDDAGASAVLPIWAARAVSISQLRRFATRGSGAPSNARRGAEPSSTIDVVFVGVGRY
jgi:hypothetical protein